MFLVVVIASERFVGLLFAEHLLVVGVGVVAFALGAGIGGIPDALYICGWVVVLVVVQLMVLHAREAQSRHAFADQQATVCVMCGARCERRVLTGPSRSANQRQSQDLVHAMLPQKITKAMRDGAHADARTLHLLVYN